MTRRFVAMRAVVLRCVFIVAALSGAAAQAMPIPFGERQAELTAREQPIAGFVQDLFSRLDIPVQVSPNVRGNVNGSFSGPAERTWRSIARAFNLVEYYDGAVLHVYSPADVGTRTPNAPSLVSPNTTGPAVALSTMSKSIQLASGST